MGDSSSSSISSEQALRAQIEKLIGENNFMRTEGTRIQSELAAFKASQQLSSAAQSVGAVHNKQVFRLRPPSIPRFKGDMGFECDNLVRDIRAMCEYVGEEDEMRWVDTAGLHMEGIAAIWFEAERNTKKTFTSWEAFVQALHQRFRPMLAADVAREKLMQLKQRGSVNHYATRFQQEMIPIQDMSKTDQIFFFCQGLLGPIAAEVRKAKPTELAEALDVAVRAELYLKDRNMNRSFSHSHSQGQFRHNSSTAGHPFSSSSSSGSSSSSAYNVPMDVNSMDCEDGELSDSSKETTTETSQLMAMIQEMRTMQRATEQKMNALFQRGNQEGSKRTNTRNHYHKKGSSNRIEGVSAEDVKKCREKGLCIKCKKEGHLARDCPHPGPPARLNF